jgi:hypothetical protein
MRRAMPAPAAMTKQAILAVRFTGRCGTKGCQTQVVVAVADVAASARRERDDVSLRRLIAQLISEAAPPRGLRADRAKVQIHTIRGFFAGNTGVIPPAARRATRNNVPPVTTADLETGI